MTIHLEAKTAYLAILLSEAGAEVTVSGSNPLSTQDDVCAALAERGVRVFATHDPSDEDFESYLHRTIETGPDLIVDDGAELVGRLIEHHPDLVGNVIGASEETTTGILKLKAMTDGGRAALPRAGRQRRQDEAPLRQPLRYGPLLHRRPALEHQPLPLRQGGRGDGLRLGQRAASPSTPTAWGPASSSASRTR